MRPDGASFLVQVAYPDCSPVMILSEASLADLNTRLAKKVKMEIFRPNIVVTGCEAFEEVSGSVVLCVTLRDVPHGDRTALSFISCQLGPFRVDSKGHSFPGSSS